MKQGANSSKLNPRPSNQMIKRTADLSWYRTINRLIENAKPTFESDGNNIWWQVEFTMGKGYFQRESFERKTPQSGFAPQAIEFHQKKEDHAPPRPYKPLFGPRPVLQTAMHVPDG